MTPVFCMWSLFFLPLSGRVPVAGNAEIFGGFLKNIGHMAAHKADMVLEAVFAQIAQKLLQSGNAAVGHAVLGGERFCFKGALSHIHFEDAFRVVCGEAHKGHRPGCHLSFAGAEGALCAQRTAEHIETGNLDVRCGEKAFGEVGAAEMAVPATITVSIVKTVASANIWRKRIFTNGLVNGTNRTCVLTDDAGNEYTLFACTLSMGEVTANATNPAYSFTVKGTLAVNTDLYGIFIG